MPSNLIRFPVAVVVDGQRDQAVEFLAQFDPADRPLVAAAMRLITENLDEPEVGDTHDEWRDINAGPELCDCDRLTETERNLYETIHKYAPNWRPGKKTGTAETDDVIGFG